MSENGMPAAENAQPQIPPIDLGNSQLFDPSHSIEVYRGFVRASDGRTVYVMTFRQGVSTFSLPFHNGPQGMLALANMLIDDAQNVSPPSGLIVPPAGARIPNLRRG